MVVDIPVLGLTLSEKSEIYMKENERRHVLIQRQTTSEREKQRMNETDTKRDRDSDRGRYWNTQKQREKCPVRGDKYKE